MGALLKELLESIKKNPYNEQLRIVCDQITKEELEKPNEYIGPRGANIFLSLSAYVDSQSKKQHFVCLEREANDEFVVSHWTKSLKQKSPLKKVRVWAVKEVTPVKILKIFIEKLQYVKGE